MNTIVGSHAFQNATTSSYNVVIGHTALNACTTGGLNTAVGRQALVSSTTGYNNTAVGHAAGDTITTGYLNTYIGKNADASASGVDHETVLGSDLTGKGSGTFYVRGNVYNGANTSAWQTTSDRRIKKNIVDNTTGLDKINQIRVRNFEYRTPDEIDYTEFVEGTNPKSIPINKEGVQLGVIAQEIEKVLPDIVETETTGVKTVNPDNLTWYLINAIKELSAEKTALKARLDAAGL